MLPKVRCDSVPRSAAELGRSLLFSSPVFTFPEPHNSRDTEFPVRSSFTRSRRAPELAVGAKSSSGVREEQQKDSRGKPERFRAPAVSALALGVHLSAHLRQNMASKLESSCNLTNGLGFFFPWLWGMNFIPGSAARAPVTSDSTSAAPALAQLLTLFLSLFGVLPQLCGSCC